MKTKISYLSNCFLILLLIVCTSFTAGCDEDKVHFVVSSGADGYNGRLRYSNNGINWNAGDFTLLPVSTHIYGLTYCEAISDDHIFAVGSGNYTYYTTDGISWTSTNLGSSQYWYDVAQGDHNNPPQSVWEPYVVAVGYDGGIMNSTDLGTTWTPISSGTTERLNCVAFGYASPNNVMTSMFVLVGNNGTIKYSVTGGDSWINQSYGFTANDLFCVDFGGSRFIAAGQTGTMMYSQNGAAWYPVNSNTTKDIYSIQYGRFNDTLIWVAVGKEGRILTGNSNGTNWTEQIVNSTHHWTDVAIGEDIIVVVGYRNDGSGIQEGKIIYSTDGVNWNTVTQSFPGMENYMWAITYIP